MGRFEIFTDIDNLFRFRFISENGETIIVGDCFSTKSNCENAIQSVRTNSGIDIRYVRLVSKERRPYFILKSFKGRVIGISEMYSSVRALENAILDVKKNASMVKIVDLTLKATAS